MKLSEIKTQLGKTESVRFKLPNGTYVPMHFHVTEVGLITKNFIDCGGTVRQEKVANFQLWTSTDTDHRLFAQKLLKIIDLSEAVLGNEDLEVEVEYQMETIGKYGLTHDGTDFVLTAKQTACLAQENCGIPAEKKKLPLAELKQTACCTPESACCV
jgi:hypothetical protein